MSWTEYYDILVRTKGNWSKATKTEMDAAVRGNPNDPARARKIAQDAWDKSHPKADQKPKEKRKPTAREKLAAEIADFDDTTTPEFTPLFEPDEDEDNEPRFL